MWGNFITNWLWKERIIVKVALHTVYLYLHLIDILTNRTVTGQL
jgi:hypothetical protein